MAGIGLAWLVTHRAPGYQTTRWQDSRRPQSWDGPDGDAIGRRVEAAGEHASELGDRVTGRVEEGVDALGRRMDDVGQRVGDVPDQVTYRVHDLSEQARSLIEESPLAVGAVAVAVGTAIGAALPSTSTERRVLRPATNRAIEDGRAEGHRGARPGGTAHERDDVWPWSVDRLDRINATESLFGWHRCIAGEQLESFQHYQHGQPEPSQLRDRFW